jgi:hypothetical protein
MPPPKGFVPEGVQVQTGISAEPPAQSQYQGVSNPPNGGQVTEEPQTGTLPAGFKPEGSDFPATTEDPHAFSKELLRESGPALLEVGKGAVKGAGSTLNNIGHLFYPDWLAKHMPGGAPSAEQQDSYFAPSNLPQEIGRGAEQAGEFLLPGGAEELGAEKLASLVPRLGKYAQPASRLATSALSTGLVNKAQGGDFSTGALAGAGGGAVGETMRAAAPSIAESALGVRGTDKIRGRTVGDAILNETSGVRPETVLSSAKDRLRELNDENENLVRQAGERPVAPVRGLLQAPQYDVPLHSSPDVSGRPSQPSVLQSNRATPREFPHYGTNAPLNSPDLGEIPGEAGDIFPPEDSGYPDRANGFGPHEYMGQRSGTQGGAGQPQGVLRTRDPDIAVQVHDFEPEARPVPYNPVSLAPARNIVSEAKAGVVAKNLPGPYHTFGELGDVVGKRFLTGEPIPEEVSPLEALFLKRGVGDFLPEGSWNPETVNRIAPVRDAMYGSLMGGLEKAVPETGPINQRISSLIPVTRRAEMAARAPGVLENTMNRFRTPTGALTGMVGGGAAGYHEGGVPGAVAGAGLGALLPSVVSSPTTQMIMARGLYDGVPKLIPAATGGALQADRGKQ